MSLEYRGTTVDVEPPDIGFQAAFGFYLGLTVGGSVVLAGVLAGATTATLLGAFPTVVTAVTIAGHLLARRARGLPERIGRARRWRFGCYLPAIAFAAAALAPRVISLEATSRYYLAAVGFAVVLGVAALGLERLCRNRFVEAVTADEPAAVWTYRPAGLLARGVVWFPLAVFVLAGGAASVAAGSPVGLLWIAIGVLVVAWIWFDVEGSARGKKYGGKRYSADTSSASDAQWGELRAHERGIRYDRGRASKLVPWESVSGVELIDDELVLQRRFRTLRCDREAIDDPEAALEAIQRLRARARAAEI
ncbi:hypothetical protein [Natrononativus amylolyticus]|uniref:hypothetical protein n=1 Tax=Natrononativus amylolyticus TaxID=2963434 RepID=UPI0020CE583A|nr:hypothetical protein [Natrononativus amylolyticus]